MAQGKKQRLQVDMTPEEVNDIDKVRQDEGIAGTYVLRRALKLYLLIWRLQKDGKFFYAEDEQGNREMIRII
jgi:hypothetical protein